MTKVGAKFGQDYRLQESQDPMYFPKRGANIILNGKTIGSMGIVHPQVLEAFHIKYPVNCFEIRLDDLFSHFKVKSQWINTSEISLTYFYTSLNEILFQGVLGFWDKSLQIVSMEDIKIVDSYITYIFM